MLAVAVRLHGIEFGLPHTLARPDEARIVADATRTLEGSWSPRSYAYPPLFAKVSAAVRWGAGRVLGTPDDPVAEIRRSYLASRVLSVLAGVASVGLVFCLGRAVGSVGTGLVAAFLLALMPLHVRDSHFGVTDVSMTFGVALALLFALRLGRAPTRRTAFLAGAAVGLACAIKYSALPVVGALIAGHLAFSKDRLRGLAWSLGGLVLAFVLFCPAILIEPSRLLHDVAREVHGKTDPKGGTLLERGWVQHALHSLRYGVGIPVLAAAVIGLVSLVRRTPRSALVLLAFAVPYYAVMGSGRIVYERYMLPLTPVLALAAAVAVERFGARFAGRRRLAAGCVSSVALVALPFTRVVHSNRLLASEDTRVVAARVLADLVGDGERTLIMGRYTSPARALCSGPRFDFRERPFLERLLRDAEDPVRTLATQYDYLVLASYYHAIPVHGAPTAATVAALLPELELVRTISPLSEGLAREDAHAVVRHDRLYVPFAGFAGFERAGPFVEVYRVPHAAEEGEDE